MESCFSKILIYHLFISPFCLFAYLLSTYISLACFHKLCEGTSHFRWYKWMKGISRGAGAKFTCLAAGSWLLGWMEPLGYIESHYSLMMSCCCSSSSDFSCELLFSRASCRLTSSLWTVSVPINTLSQRMPDDHPVITRHLCNALQHWLIDSWGKGSLTCSGIFAFCFVPDLCCGHRSHWAEPENFTVWTSLLYSPASFQMFPSLTKGGRGGRGVW